MTCPESAATARSGPKTRALSVRRWHRLRGALRSSVGRHSRWLRKYVTQDRRLGLLSHTSEARRAPSLQLHAAASEVGAQKWPLLSSQGHW